jgi:hypothetical protein
MAGGLTEAARNHARHVTKQWPNPFPHGLRVAKLPHRCLIETTLQKFYAG